MPQLRMVWCARSADDYVVIDKNEAKVKETNALDFQDARSQFESSRTKYCVNDYQALADADVVVSALGNIKLQD